jgi:hypothetical protein
MRLAEQEWNSGLGWYERQQSCSAADYFSRMWCHDTFVDEVPLFGPHPVYRALYESEIEQALGDIASSFRNLCLYDLKRVDLASVITRDEWEYELRQLGDRFFFKNIRAVTEFLELHRSLTKVLFDVRQKVDQHFGPDTQTNLELFIDPEDDTEDSKLFALILTALPSREASARLDQLDQEWWLEQPYEVKCAMNIDIQYIDGSV